MRYHVVTYYITDGEEANVIPFKTANRAREHADLAFNCQEKQIRRNQKGMKTGLKSSSLELSDQDQLTIMQRYEHLTRRLYTWKVETCTDHDCEICRQIPGVS